LAGQALSFAAAAVGFTAIIGFALGVDRDDGSAVEVLNAGHSCPVHRLSRTLSRWAATDPLLGLAGAHHSLHTTDVHSGDLVVICTDGLELGDQLLLELLVCVRRRVPATRRGRVMATANAAPTPEPEVRLRHGRALQLRSAAAFARACHVGPALAVTAFTGALAWRSGRDPGGLLAVGAAVLAGQAAVGLSNDYLDRVRDCEAGRSDKPIVAGAISPRAVGAGALAAGAVCVPLSLLSGRSAALTHFGAVAAALSYNRWFKFSVLSPVPYAVAFGALPSFVSFGSVGRSLAPAPITVAAALLGVGAHFINTLPDVAADERTGVRGLPQRLGPLPSLVIGAGLLGTSTAVIAVVAPALGAVGAALVVGTGVCLAGVVAFALTERERWAWGTSLVAAASTVGLAVTCGVVA